MEEKSCFNCKFFMQHYVLGKDTVFAVNCGHCLHAEADRLKRDRRRNFGYPCALWERLPAEEINIDGVLSKLRYTAVHIADISLILKEMSGRSLLPQEKREEKSCYTCKDFMRYYVKSFTNLRGLNAGGCKNTRVSPQKKKTCPNADSCRYWTENAPRAAEERGRILCELAAAEKQLKNIAAFLKAMKKS